MTARILIIEDNAGNLELMSYLLRASGHAITSAADGASGIEAARETHPDLVLCDVQMPKVDGFEVIRRLRDGEPRFRVPIVAVTALAMAGDRESLVAAGFDGYLAKPITPETFVKEVEAVLPPPRR